MRMSPKNDSVVNRQKGPAPSPEPRSGLVLQRSCACGSGGGAHEDCAECKSNNLSLQRSPISSNRTTNAPPIVGDVLRSPGRPLDQPTRAFFEPRFGHDFSRVRVHSDTRAAESASAVNSLAFTLGNNIVFGEGQFSPQTDRGKHLLAHELTHVIQQGPAIASKSSISVGPPDDQYEREADRVAEGVLNGAGPARVTTGATPVQPTIRRKCPPLAGGSSGCAGADKTAAAETKGPAKVPEFTLGGKERVQWRVSYNQKKETDSPRALLKDLHISAEEPFQEGKQWTFCYCPLSKAEAEAAAKSKQKDFGDKVSVTARLNDRAKSYYLEAKLKCPDAIPAKAGYDVWGECFGEKDAKAHLKKFQTANVQAEVFKLDDTQFGLYYKPMTEKDAKKAGQDVASKRPGFAEGMFSVNTSERTDLKSFTYSIKTSCPAGYTDKGQFRITTYVLAQEKEFAEKPTVKDPCGLKGTFREGFLFRTGKIPPLGVKKEGSGVSLSGSIIQYAPKGGKDCFEEVSCPKTKAGTCATAGTTVAVDRSVIPLKSNLLIEDVGPRVAEDTGGQVNRDHIDVYRGTELTAVEANKASMSNKKVCVKK